MEKGVKNMGIWTTEMGIGHDMGWASNNVGDPADIRQLYKGYMRQDFVGNPMLFQMAIV